MNKTNKTGMIAESTERRIVAKGEIGYGRFSDEGVPMLFIPGVATPGRFWAGSVSYSRPAFAGSGQSPTASGILMRWCVIGGVKYWLRRAIASDGDVLDICNDLHL